MEAKNAKVRAGRTRGLQCRHTLADLERQAGDLAQAKAKAVQSTLMFMPARLMGMALSEPLRHSYL